MRACVICTSVPFRFSPWSSSMNCTIPVLWNWRLPSLSCNGGCISRPACCALLALWWVRCSTKTFGVQSLGLETGFSGIANNRYLFSMVV